MVKRFTDSYIVHDNCIEIKINVKFRKPLDLQLQVIEIALQFVAEIG